MIYIFNGCGAVCKAPCQACDAACGCLSKTCGNSCKCFFDIFRGFFKAISDFFSPVFNGPLGFYVLGTWGFNACIIATAGLGVSTIKCDKPKTFCIVLIALGLVHMFFAHYIQRKLIKELGGDYKTMEAKDIVAKAQHVMLYDVGFCIYFFIFAGSFFYPMYGITELGKCNGTGPVWSGAALMIVYIVVTWHFVMCWYVKQCCCRGVDSGRQALEEQRKAAAAAAATKIGRT